MIALGLLASLAWLRGAQAIAALVAVETVPLAYTLFYFLTFAPLVAIGLILGRVAGQEVLRAGSNRGRWTGVGLLCGTGGLAVAVFYAWLNGGLAPGASGFEVSAGYIILGVALTAFQVSAEELLFRGWLMPAVDRLIGRWPAVLISAAAFSLFHAVGGAHAVLSFVNLFLGGVWFALLALRSGGLLAPIAAHFGWNAAEDLGLGLVPNPGVGDLGALADRDLLGSALWGGSDEGLNASIGMTLVLIALILPLLRPPRPAAA